MPKVHYRVHKSLKLLHVLRQLSPVLSFRTLFLYGKGKVVPVL
jgi:hypothetical protein